MTVSNDDQTLRLEEVVAHTGAPSVSQILKLRYLPEPAGTFLSSALTEFAWHISVMTMDLTDADLQEIRRLSARTHLQLARRYGISAEAVDAIVRGRPWRHLRAKKRSAAPEAGAPEDDIDPDDWFR